jgi:hypothetical protein
MKSEKLLYNSIKSAKSSGFTIGEHLTLTGLLRSYLHVIDDGIGFTESSFPAIATLGAGTKRDIPFQFSRGKRHYLGSYGYGLKSTLNVATKVEIESYSQREHLSATIDWNLLDDALKPDFAGFPCSSEKLSGARHGTHIKLALKNPTTKAHLDRFGEVLANLPSDEGKYQCFFGMYGDVATDLPITPRLFDGLRKRAERLVRKNRLQVAGTSFLADIHDCAVQEFTDKIDKSVRGKIYFAGLENEKVKPLKPGLRGIYVRIHGRLLKQSFTDSKFTYSISKWKKFESGTRVELSVDWLRDQISLSRTGVRFSNDKLEEDFKGILTRCVSAFIQPQLKAIEKKRRKVADKRTRQRIELVRKRSGKQSDVVIPGMTNGFVFKPETDGELALVIAQPSVQARVLKGYKLLDYNDQAPFDCVLFDERRREFVNAELEPNLMAFIDHKEKEDVQLVIAWTRGQWRIGAKKRSNHGHLCLVADPEKRRGHYRLLEFPSGRSKKPRKDYPVLIVEEAI